ncbi:unnamed protein product [Caenorhabditis brenneri]
MGLSCSKLLKTTSNSSNNSYNSYSLTEYSTVSTRNFPLLRLPFIAWLEVFKSLDPIEIFILSQCSRKVANCVRITGSKKWKLSVDVGLKQILINNHYRLRIIESSRGHTWEYDKNFITFGNSELQKVLAQLQITFALAQLQVSLGCPVTSFAYTGWRKSHQCWVSVLNYIIHNQTQPLESFELWGTFKNEDLEWALQNVRVSGKINIHLLETLNFTSHFRPECEQITFLSSNPLCLDLIKFKSCKYIRLTLALTMHDLDVFMKEWMAGSFPNLQYMLIERSQLNSSEYILGFRKSEMSQRGVRRSLVIDEYQLVYCTGGVDIQAENGTKATMQMDRGSPNSFELFILSQCSKRVANFVHIVGSKKWKLSVFVGSKCIDINDSHKVIITESSMKTTWKYDRRVKTFLLEYQKSENSKLELRKVLSLLQAAFRCPVTSFEYTSLCKSDQCWISILKHISQNQTQPLESLDIRSHFNKKDLDWALQNVKVTRKIDIRIRTSKFPSINHMMFKSCKCIELNLSWLPICALNVFMEEWKAESLPNLQYMSIRSDTFYWYWYDHILGFKRDDMKQSGVRRRLLIDEKQSIDCTGGVDIQSENGTKATMQMERKSPDWFELFVWKE